MEMMKENKKSDNQKNKGETVDRPSDCKGLRIVTRLIILFVTAAAVIAFMLIGSCFLVVRFYHIPAPAPAYTAEKAPDTVRIAALTDLHGRMIGENQGKIVGRVQEIRPDLIVCLGDMVDRSRAEESETALAVLVKQLTAIAPVYYVDGNHELDIRDSDPEIYARLNTELEAAGAVHLENEIVRFMIDDEDTRPEGMELEAAAVGKVLDKGALGRKGTVVNLCGITTHYYWGEAEYALVDRLRQMDGVNILLCHYPESVLWYDAFEGGGLDAALCGHTHGGLIRLPFVGGVFAPEQGWWPRYDQGAYPVYTDTDKRNYGGGKGSQYLGTMIISAGLAGEHGVPRINNPKEISVVEISGISGP
ncbi:MAG: hypothetical protein E7239_01410 [Sarcina sp.]|nr:hypothetical protein [Sarcina sp.]